MKKILSISNVLIKRLALIVTLVATIGVGEVWAAVETTLKVSKSPSSGAGNAYVATTETGEYASSRSQSSGSWYNTTGTHTYWLKAETTSTAWLWKGWYLDGSLKLSALSGSTTVKDDKLVGSVTETYTATWVQPKVTGTTEGTSGGTNIKVYAFGEYNDPTIGSDTKNIVFTLENNDAGLIAKDGTQPDSYYTEALTGSWTATTFVKNSHTYAKGNQNYTYNVIYKLSGVHATNITADIKLTSKYGGTNCTARLKATENYTPYFKYAYEEYNYTPNDPLAEGQSLTQTFNVSKECYAANNGVWSVSLPADAAAKGFTLQTAADNPDATVKFEALPGMNKADLTTTLTATCTYTDAKGTKVTYTQTIVLSGDAGKVITLDGAEENTLTFDIDYATSGETTLTLPFMTTLTGLTTTPNNLPAGDYITYTTWTTGLTEVSATVKHNLTPGQYTSTVKYSYNNDEVYAILHIVANIRLAQPVVTATVGQGQQITLSWPSVLGATSYIIEGKRTADANFTQLNIIGDDEAIATSFVVDNIGGIVLTTGTDYTFRVMAVYGPDAFANRWSEEVSASPTAVGSITSSSNVELYTGTEIFVAGNTTYGVFPYHKKRAIDLDAAFSPTGAPLFDRLYIFGITSSATTTTVSGQTGHKITPANASNGSDAVTPCYVYVKNGNQYDLQQTIPNMNVKDKPIADISGATSVYLTGYCPYASTGGKDSSKEGAGDKNDNGVFCFTGGQGVNLHVYIDDLHLFPRAKNMVGKVGDPDTIKYSINTTFYAAGNASAFCFKGTSTRSSNPFKPVIHMRDSNRLTGTAGSSIKVELSFLGMSMVQTAGQYNSPIGFISDDGKKYTELSIDDVWPASMVDNASGSVRTNGYLDIRGESGAPCIDLYDEKGKVNFNGGRYYLKNSLPTGSNNYLCTFAVGYRKYVKEVSGIEATMYGLGTDQSGGEAHFNDGSFYVEPISDANMTKYGQYYHHKTALKCPASSTINGGTFYCEPFASTESANKGTSPLNKYGDGLVLDTVEVMSLLEPYKTAVIEFPNDKEVQPEYAATYPATLGEYYTEKGSTYGISSLNPYQGTQAPDSVILMLPVQYTDKKLQNDMVNIPWALCVPGVEAGGTIPLGGDVEVKDREENNTIYQTNFILYGGVDSYIQEIVENGSYKTPDGYDGLPSAGVEFTGGMFSEVTNQDSYTIQMEQYMLMSITADEWFLFTPPFDISEVYVVETYNEEALATSTSWQDAIDLQAAANMDFFYALCYNIGYLEAANGLDAIYYDWSVTLAKNNNAKGKIKLNHFTGSNYAANYYLQRSSGTWEWDAEKERFVTDWKYLPETMEKVTHGDTEYSVVMKKGEIYSMKFPYMYYGYRESGDVNYNWDYWTGKYILLVGKGPQTIEGINYHDNIDADMTALPGTAEVRVNPTFAAIEISDMGAYFLGDNQQFNCNPDNDWGEILPTSGFVLLANTNTSSPMPQRIKSIDMQTGDVTYDNNGGSNQDGVTTSTPTIGGNNHMLVYNIEGGVGIVPVVEQQVSIYNAAGQLITSQYLTDEVHIPLPSGIYLIAGAKEQFKAVVK